MARVNEIYGCLDRHAPFDRQMSFDNSGFLVGKGEADVSRVLVTLDITSDAAEEAGELGCQLILSHHPLIFHPLRSLTDADTTGRILLKLVEKGIAAICAHTNLDVAEEGVNDALAQALSLSNTKLLQAEGTDENGVPYGLGRVGFLNRETTPEEFARFVREALGVPGVRLCKAGERIRKVAVAGGSCGELMEAAAKLGCDAFVTSEVKHHIYLEAMARGISVIDAGHFSTENVVCCRLAQWVEQEFPDVKVFISQRNKEVFSCH